VVATMKIRKTFEWITKIHIPSSGSNDENTQNFWVDYENTHTFKWYAQVV